MVYTYLLKSSINYSFYVGIAKDPFSRLREHNNGKVESTKKFKNWKLVYVKKHNNYKEARKHEKWLKKKNIMYKNKLAGQAATRYLDDLEKEVHPAPNGRGQVRQVGKTGKHVYYEKIP